MNAHELLEVYDRTLAFETIMKGGLKKEMEQAKAALDNLKLGKDLCLVRNQLVEKERAFEEYKKGMEEQFVKEQKELLDYNELLSAREAKLVEEQKLLAADKATHENDKTTHEQHKAHHTHKRQQETETLTRQREELETARTELVQAQSEVARHEAALNKKLEVLKNI